MANWVLVFNSYSFIMSSNYNSHSLFYFLMFSKEFQIFLNLFSKKKKKKMLSSVWDMPHYPKSFLYASFFSWIMVFPFDHLNSLGYIAFWYIHNTLCLQFTSLHWYLHKHFYDFTLIAKEYSFTYPKISIRGMFWNIYFTIKFWCLAKCACNFVTYFFIIILIFHK